MRKEVIITACLVGLLLPACGCEEETGPITGAGLGEEFKLAIGEEAVITGEGLRLVFEEVIEDSRCPKNVECVWAGRARYAVEFTLDGAPERAVITEEGGETGGISVFDYAVESELEPYPEDPDSIATEDYQLRMTIRKAAVSQPVLEEQADIYAAVIRQLYTSDHSFGANPPEFPNLYIVYTTSDRTGGDFQTPAMQSILTEPLRTMIMQRLGDLPAEVHWVSSFGEVPLGENSGVKGGGAIISAGNIHEMEDGTVQVAGSIYVANLAASGRTYILEKQNGKWRITGDTGMIWVS